MSDCQRDIVQKLFESRKLEEAGINVDNPYKYYASSISDKRSDGVYEFNYEDSFQRDKSISLLKSLGLHVVGKFKNPQGYLYKYGLLVRESSSVE